MAGDGDAPQVQPVLPGLDEQVVKARRNILKSSGIAAAGMADPAVFQVREGVAAITQVRGHTVHQLETGQVGAPATAVDQDDDGITALSARQPEFAELKRVRALGNPLIRSGAGLGEKLAEGIGRAGLDRIDDRL